MLDLNIKKNNILRLMIFNYSFANHHMINFTQQLSNSFIKMMFSLMHFINFKLQ